MSGETNDESDECPSPKSPYEIVNHKGFTWIIRRSKSHNGMPYFYNLATRCAVWNLTDSEIEKAMLNRNLEKEIDNNDCPEPKDPPVKQNNVSREKHQTMSEQCNRQFVENKFNNTQIPCFPSTSSKISPFVPILHIPQVPQIGLNVSAPVFNPNVWAVNPLLMNPPVNPGLSECHTFVNPYNDRFPVQNTSVSLSNGFQNVISDNRNLLSETSKLNKEYQHPIVNKNLQTNFPQRIRSNNPATRGKSIGSFDLRNKLSARKGLYKEKREKIFIKEAEENVVEQRRRENQNKNNDFKEERNLDIESVQNKDPNSYNSDVDIDWDENNANQRDLKVDVSCLKKLAKHYTNLGQWYIAADKNILLYHLNFLTMLLESDDSVRLLIVGDDMESLRLAARASVGLPRSVNRSRRALLFLTQLLKDGRALLGEATQDSSVKHSKILKCCSNLTQQNFFVVLLTNEKEIQDIKGLLNIPIFTMREVRDFIFDNTENDSTHEESEQNQDRIVKITFNNNLMHAPTEVGTNTNELMVREAGTMVDFDDELITSSTKTETLQEKQQEQVLSQPHRFKKTTNVYVQTEQLQESQVHVESSTTLPPPQIAPINSEIVSSSNICNNTSNSSCERRLIRSTPRQTNVSNNSNPTCNDLLKKQFKWRKKRNPVNPPEIHPQCSSANTSRSHTELGSAQIVERNQSTHNNSTSESNQMANYSSEDCVEGSESSSTIVHRTINEKVIIEETSTSGVISNTSQADSESDSIKQHEVSFTHVLRKCYMYEVKDEIMEQRLRTRSDEWISRFVQIMEEALAQILRHGGGPIWSLMPPPWTLHEAAVCITHMFRNYVEVTDAANKLLDVLSSVTNKHGRININLKPSEYMKMYSYGVYLIQTLLSTTANCEDLKTASTSLSNLLKDISNPNVDANNDPFCDSSRLYDVKGLPLERLQQVMLAKKDHNQITLKSVVEKKRPPAPFERFGIPRSTVENPERPITSVESSEKPRTTIENPEKPITSVESFRKLRRPVENLGKSRTPVEISGKTVEKAQKSITPVESSIKPKTLAENSGKHRTHVEGSGKSTTAVENPSKSRSPIEYPGKPIAPEENPVKPRTPVENPVKCRAPVENLGKPIKPVKSSAKATIAIENPGKCRTPVENLGKPIQPVKSSAKSRILENPGKYRAHVEQLGKSRMFVENPGKPRTPVEILGKPLTPVESSANPTTPIENFACRTPAEHIGKPITPVESPGITATPVEGPGKPTTPVESPRTPRTSVQSPRNARTTADDPGNWRSHVESSGKPRTPKENHEKHESTEKPTTLLDSPEDPRTPVESSGNLRTLVGSPDKSRTLVESPEKPRTSVKSHGKPRTLVESPGKPRAIVESHEQRKAPVQSPENPITPVEIPGNLKTPVESPGNSRTTVQDPENSRTHVESHGKPITPVKSPWNRRTPVESTLESPENSRTPVASSGNLRTLVGSPEKPRTLVESPEKPRTPVESSGKRKAPVESPEKFRKPAESSKKLRTTAKSSIQSRTTAKSSVQPRTPTEVPEKPSTATKSLGKRYNLRRKRNTPKEKTKLPERIPNERDPTVSTEVSSIRDMDIESDFFTSLHLRKTTPSPTNVANSSNSRDEIPRLHCNLEALHSIEKDVNEKGQDTEPKIIRQFSKFSEFEKRLSNKSRQCLDMDLLDYSEDVEPHEDGNDSFIKEEAFGGGVNYKEDNLSVGTNDLTQSNLLGKEKQGQFDIGRLFSEIKRAFFEVHTFYKETHKELIGTQNATCKNREILIKAEAAHAYFNNFRKHLDSILYRESFSAQRNDQSILKRVEPGVNSDAIVMGYRDMISKCIDRTKELLDSIKLIKTGVTAH